MMHRLLVALSLIAHAFAVPGELLGETALHIDSPQSPPEWALLQRELLRANSEACREFADRYFDDRGFLMCVVRWGGDDGPDDAIECCADWPLLFALGAEEDVLTACRHAWEGHLRQYTAARTEQVPLGRNGMYFKEFPVMFDWVHLGEGLTPFAQLGLAIPDDPKFQARLRRFAGFYLGDDPGTPNYDPQHRLIRSLFNGSRGPLLRKTTALDWAGDPIDVEHRFDLRHGERNYAEMLAHFEDYNDIIGDHPQNLCATSLALYAYMLDHEPKYRTWLLDYVDAWCERTDANGGIIPTNIGLDGNIGSACEGKWYGGVYGWAFSVKVPQTGALAHRNTHQLGLVGFGNAYLLTGNDDYLEVWRRMTNVINDQGKMVDGQFMSPTMHGDQGWYAFRAGRYAHGAQELHNWSWHDDDRVAVNDTAWIQYLNGEAPRYPIDTLRRDLERVRSQVAAMREDKTTPDTRLADDPLRFNPASTNALVQLTLGGVHPGRYAGPLHCRLRYFDPRRRRAGLPQDVAALVTKISATDITIQLVNINQLESRDVIVQAGAYAEHQIERVTSSRATVDVDAPTVLMRLGPGCGDSLTIRTERYAHQPTLAHPWSLGVGTVK